MTSDQRELQLRAQLHTMLAAVLDRSWAIAITEATRFVAICATELEREARAARRATHEPHAHLWLSEMLQCTRPDLVPVYRWHCTCGAVAIGPSEPSS